ncbi:MAG: chromosome segregation protein SMC [Coriobacteriia bacterium]|nr:chromosome segregation protein SMC [Coriobacteriia bacterium]
MYLKSLTLRGFKSFADKVSMHFEPGMTVIVGPNGSGKSNISDAMLWVLGEQSAKILRGQAMEDVIFSGSSARKAVGLAEVVIVLDNSDHTLPIEFSELAITRRMYRNGESEYLINNAPARLREIHDILHDSGIGKDAHSIISQGKLGEILQSRPEERRVLIEEAAGISKHKKRKERSLKKVQVMQGHIDRAKDIQREMKKQLKPLEAQVNKAKQQQELSADLAYAQTVLAVDDLRMLKRAYDEVSEGNKEREAALELENYRVGEKEKELSKLQVMLEERGLFVGDLAEQRRRLQSILGSFDANQRLLEEKASYMVSRLSELRASVHKFEKQAGEAQALLEHTEEEYREARAKDSALHTLLLELRETSGLARSQRISCDEKLKKLNGELRNLSKINDQESLELSKAQDALAHFKLEDSLFEDRLKQITDSLSIDEHELQLNQSKQAEVHEKIVKLETYVNQSDLQEAQLQETLSSTKAARDDADSLLRELKIQSYNLAQQKARYESGNKLLHTVREFLHGNESRHLSDLFTAPKELEELLELVLQDELSALLVQGEELASVQNKEGLRKAQDTQGSAFLFALSKHDQTQTRKIKGAKPLVDLLEIKAEHHDLVHTVFKDYYLVASALDALELSKKHPDAIFIGEDFTRSSHANSIKVFSKKEAQAQKETGILYVNRQLEEVGAKLEGAKRALSLSEEKVSQAQEKLQGHLEARDKHKEELAYLKATEASLMNDAGKLSSHIKSYTAELTSVQERRDQARMKSESAQPKIEELSLKLATYKKSMALQEEEIARLQAERDDIRFEESKAFSELSQTQLELASLAERLKYLDERKVSLEAQMSADKEDHEVNVKTIVSIEEKLKRVEPLHNVLAKLNEDAQSWAFKLKDQALLEEAGSSDLKKTIAEARTAVLQCRQKRDELMALQAEDKARQATLDLQVKQAISRIEQHKLMVLDEALKLEAPENRDELLARIQKLEDALASIGPVNQVAMEQFTELKARCDFIDGQVADMLEAKSALKKIVNAIDRKMRNQFMETYEQVNAHFQEIFKNLFIGGRAYLELTDPDNPAETGIEVVAQPKGKKVNKMMLLSGGEKSLTALALLFAVYKTRAVPFYVLDEVEAALDDANLQRLLKTLEVLRKDTQLIVVSHQRQTMERADLLYGVSMQADGVSHVLSQKLDGLGHLLEEN